MSGSSGAVAGLVVLLEDVLSRVEDMLTSSATRDRAALVETMDEALLRVDEDGVVRDANAAARDLLAPADPRDEDLTTLLGDLAGVDGPPATVTHAVDGTDRVFTVVNRAGGAGWTDCWLGLVPSPDVDGGPDRSPTLSGLAAADRAAALLDARGHVAATTPALSELLGTARSALRGTELAAVVDAEAASVEESLATLSDAQPGTTHECDWPLSDGGPAGVTLSRLDPDREPAAMAVAVWDAGPGPDVDGVPGAEQPLVEVLGDPVYALSPDNEITYVNRAAAELAGYPVDELEGNSLHLLLDESEVDRCVHLAEDLLARPDERRATVEVDLVTSDGRRVPVENHLTVLEGPDGEYAGLVGVLRDVSERHERLDELEQFEVIMQAVPDPVYATDAEGHVTFTNRAFVERLGYDPEDREDGRLHFSEFTTDEHTERILEALRSLIADEDGAAGRETAEIVGIAEDGRKLRIEASIALLPSEDEFRGAAGVLRDVTDRKRRKEVFQVMNRALRHNLRTHVNTITGYAEVLEDAVEEVHAEELGRIRDSAEWLGKLGSTLRNLQEAIDESIETDATVDVETMVEGAVDRYRSSHEDTEIDVHFATTGRLDAGHPVRYALEHVVENAIVHNDAEHPAVNVWVANAPREGWIDIHVEDNGSGIPEDERDIVLGEATITQLQHGSGIGLWITRWIVEVFDGEIEIEEGDPRGTVVTLRLRRADEES